MSRSLATAVLTNGKLHMSRDGQFEKTIDVELPPVELLAMLCEQAYKHRISTTWIAPTEELCMPIVENPTAWLATPGYDIQPTTRYWEKPVSEENLPRFVSMQKGHFRRNYVALTGLDKRWSNNGFHLADIEEGLPLLGGITYLQRALDLNLAFSPGYSAIALMKRLIPAKKPEIAENHPSLFELPDYNEKDSIWYRKFSAAERGAKYIHIFDRNSMYLAAGTGATLGYGACSYTTEFDPKQVGAMWEIRNETCSKEIAELFPPAFKRTNYATTDMIIQARLLGYEIEIEGGWIFENRTRALAEWSNLLWRTRELFRAKEDPLNFPAEYPNATCRKIAYEVTKILATRGVGWLGLSESDYSRQWYKKHWKNQIIGLARARMLLTMRTLYEKYNLAPLLCYTDAIGYASDDPNPATAVPDIMRRKDELGGFKFVRTVAINKEVRDMFNDHKLAAWQIMHELKIQKNTIDDNGFEIED